LSSVSSASSLSSSSSSSSCSISSSSSSSLSPSFFCFIFLLRLRLLLLLFLLLGRKAQGEGRKAQGEGIRAKGAGRRAQGAGRRAQGPGRRTQCVEEGDAKLAKGAGRRTQAQKANHQAQKTKTKHQAQKVKHKVKHTKLNEVLQLSLACCMKPAFGAQSTVLYFRCSPFDHTHSVENNSENGVTCFRPLPELNAVRAIPDPNDSKHFQSMSITSHLPKVIRDTVFRIIFGRGSNSNLRAILGPHFLDINSCVARARQKRAQCPEHPPCRARNIHRARTRTLLPENLRFAQVFGMFFVLGVSRPARSAKLRREETKKNRDDRPELFCVWPAWAAFEVSKPSADNFRGCQTIFGNSGTIVPNCCQRRQDVKIIRDKLSRIIWVGN
jgi:hypothetical protein